MKMEEMDICSDIKNQGPITIKQEHEEMEPDDLDEHDEVQEPEQEDEDDQSLGMFPTSLSSTSLDLDLKTEPEEPDSGFNSSFTSTGKLNTESHEYEEQEDEEKGEEEEDEEMENTGNEDPLAALASAALDASKDNDKTEFNGADMFQEPVKVSLLILVECFSIYKSLCLRVSGTQLDLSKAQVTTFRIITYCLILTT